ncbi:hypothetical protein IE53DRAFT_366173 [Violaceomyces palustris]|uniref:Uncharacterized protein n=1 Tax=Violaceomyces palustris TaxID=1673888 RepID=A0ACD0P6D4_9BASI|nr:hypothetical protein IE53DRAFT_366173 [Violaceomyces palustris]
MPSPQYSGIGGASGMGGDQCRYSLLESTHSLQSEHDSDQSMDRSRTLDGANQSSSSSSSASSHYPSLHLASQRQAYLPSQPAGFSSYANAEAGMGLTSTSSSFTYESAPSDPSHLRSTGQYFGNPVGAYPSPSSFVGQGYGMPGPSDQDAFHQPLDADEIESLLTQISSMYKNASTKKNAEFYRDKWARVWLGCNYNLKTSIQISIPRTILHESYRRTCEAFGIEPLQAASFGKVLRGQYPDISQRRLGGRGKTRFHYCGFGPSNEREAVKIKQLLEEEKSGKLQLSAGLSAGIMAELRARAENESDSEGTASRDGHGEHGSSELNSLSTGSASASSRTPTSLPTNNEFIGSPSERMAASAFATLNSAVPGQPHTSMPRRHTLSSGSSSYRDHRMDPPLHSASDVQRLSASGELVSVGMPIGLNMPYNLSVSNQFQQQNSNFSSENNSPNPSQVSIFADQQHVQAAFQGRRSCRELPGWPRPNTSDKTIIVSGSSSSGRVWTLSSVEGPIAWSEYESFCQYLLQDIDSDLNVSSFDKRTLMYWKTLSGPTMEALCDDGTLCEVILAADTIIFRQLLGRLDERFGEDVPDSTLFSLQSMTSDFVSSLKSVLEGRLPHSFVDAKINMAEEICTNLSQAVQIFKSVQTFRGARLLGLSPDSSMIKGTEGWNGDHSGLPGSMQASPIGPYHFSQGFTHLGLPSNVTQDQNAAFTHGSHALQHGRRRDNSVSSTSTWLSDRFSSSPSSACESEFSLHSSRSFAGSTSDVGLHGHGSGMQSWRGFLAADPRRISKLPRDRPRASGTLFGDLKEKLFAPLLFNQVRKS